MLSRPLDGPFKSFILRDRVHHSPEIHEHGLVRLQHFLVPGIVGDFDERTGSHGHVRSASDPVPPGPSHHVAFGSCRRGPTHRGVRHVVTQRRVSGWCRRECYPCCMGIPIHATPFG